MQPRNRNSIRIHPVGGLGNQLFIWAAGLTLARRTGMALEVDYRRIERDEKRDAELATFDNGCSLAPGLPNATEAPSLPKGRMWGKSRKPTEDVFKEASYRFDQRFDTIKGPVELDGYFQSWRYFKEAEAEVNQRISAVQTPSDWYLELSGRLRARTKPLTILHLRTGDYLRPEVGKLHGNASTSYYRSALNVVSSLGVVGDVLAFTDDPGKAHEALDGICELEVAVPPADSAPVESVVLMSEGDAHIIANSSFGWWAATLARSKSSGPVIAPRPWFGELTHDTRDLLWPDWLTLDRRDFSGELRHFR